MTTDRDTLRAIVGDLRQMWHDATFGPWSADGAIVTGRTPDGDPCRVADCRTSNREHDEDNAAFIAETFNALPALLDAADELFSGEPTTGDVRDLLRDLDRLLRDHHQRDHAQAHDSAHYRERIAKVLATKPAQPDASPWRKEPPTTSWDDPRLANDPNKGRMCGHCNGIVPAGTRYSHGIGVCVERRMDEQPDAEGEALREARERATRAIVELDAIMCGPRAKCEGPCERATMYLLPLANPTRDENWSAAVALAKLDAARGGAR